MAARARSDITGQRFGRLFVVELGTSTNSRGERYWDCLCDCGNHTTAMFSSLSSGKTQSCGCLKREATIASNKRNKSVDPKIRFSSGYAVADNGCWEWQKGKDEKGYGVLHVDGKQEKAHRFSWKLYNGEIPVDDSYHGTMVCHHCDNPACVNPDHLFIGVAKDNVLDMVSKGRNRCGVGERHGSRTHPEKYLPGEGCARSKLKDSDVIEIRKAKQSRAELAKRYGVTEGNILAVQKRKSWRHL